MATLVQTAKSLQILPLPASLTGASGTSGLMEVTVTFADPITAGNDILLSVTGDLQNAGAVVSLGAILGFLSYAPGGTLPDRTYWIGLTYTDSSGTESMMGSVGSIDIPANNLVRVFKPNIEPSSGHPGISNFSIYASEFGPTGLGVIAANLNPDSPTILPVPQTYWQEPDTGISPGSGPPSTPAYDTLGNSYTECSWIDQFEGGSNSGHNAMGFFLASGSAGGANAIKFLCAAHNNNPTFTFDGVLSVIACEFTPDLGATEDTTYLKLGSGTGAIDLSLTDSNSDTIDTDWGTRTGNTAMVLDLSPAPGTDSFFAMFCNALQPGADDPPTPTLTGGEYTFIDSQSPDSIPHWLWYSSPISSTPSISCPIDGGTATVGVPYSAQLVASGGTEPYTFSILSGALPDGLTLDTATGIISGTPTLAATFDYVAEVTDADAQTADTSPGCEIVVSEPAVPVTLACPIGGGAASVGVFYDKFLDAEGGTPPYTFAIIP